MRKPNQPGVNQFYRSPSNTRGACQSRNLRGGDGNLSRTSDLLTRQLFPFANYPFCRKPHLTQNDSLWQISVQPLSTSLQILTDKMYLPLLRIINNISGQLWTKSKAHWVPFFSTKAEVPSSSPGNQLFYNMWSLLLCSVTKEASIQDSIYLLQQLAEKDIKYLKNCNHPQTLFIT